MPIALISLRRHRPSVLARSIAALLAVTVLPPFAMAGQIWDGGGGNGLWSNNANWNLNTAPVFANPLQFDGVLQLLSNNDATASVAGITFNAGAGAFTLNGNAVTMNGGLLNLSANTQTVSFGSITLGSAQTFNASAANMTVTTNVALGANTLTIDGANVTTLGGVLSGTGGLTKNGTGLLGLGGANIYSGATTVNDGVLQSQAPGSLSPNSDFTVTGTGILDLASHNSTIRGLNDGGTATGRVSNSAASPATLTLGNGGASGTFAGTIEAFGAGPLGITKIGSGTQTFSGANTYTGGTILQNGTLFADSNTALGTGTLTITSAGGATTLGSQVLNTTLTNPISVESNFSLVAPAAGNKNFFLDGPIDLNGATRVLTGRTHQGQFHFRGIISDGGVTLSTAGLSGAGPGDNNYVAFIYDSAVPHTYTGLTTVNTGAFLVFEEAGEKLPGDVLIQGNGVVDYLGVSNQISDTATVTVNSLGSTILNGTVFQGLELFNNSDTIGSLFGTGTVGLGDGSLTVGAGNFSGQITDGERGVLNTGGNFTKNTAGTLALTGANTYTGTTTVTGGTLNVTGSVASPTINVTGGTFIAGRNTAVLPGTAVTASGGGFEYRAVDNMPLTIGSLTLNSGPGTTIGGSIGSTFTGPQIIVTSAVNPTPGNIQVNVFGVPGVATGTPGIYTLLTASPGSTLNVGTTYTLGDVFNATNFTVSAVGATATTITATIAAATPLDDAYWVGGRPGAPNVWSASGNWASDNMGTPTQLIPSAVTDVFFSAGPPAMPFDTSDMTLGTDMAIASLSVNAPGAPETRTVTLNRSGDDTLTIATAGGVNIFAGAGAVSLNPDLILGASQTWTNNSANTFTVGGSVTNGGNTLTVAGSGATLLTGVLGNGAGGLRKDGTGSLTLTQNNTYTGDTHLLGGSLFAEVAPGSAANKPFGTGRLFVSGGTTLGSSVNNQRIPNPVTFQGGSHFISTSTAGFQNLIFTGPIDLAAGTRELVGTTAAGQVNFVGAMTNGAITLSNSTPTYTAFIYGAADTNPAGDVANTYTGLTTVNDGAFLVLNKSVAFAGGDAAVRGDILVNPGGSVDYLNVSNQIADTSNVTVHGSGILLNGTEFAAFELRNNTDTIGSLSGSGTVGLGSGILTVGAGTFSGSILDGDFGAGGQLTKNTTGVLTLTGASTFTGNTNVNNGTLILNGSVQSPTLFVNFSGTLMGSGTAARNVVNAGIFSPGQSPGTFRIGGNYTQTGAGLLIIEIEGTKAGQHDLVQVGGTASLDGDLRIVNVRGTRLKVGEKVTFLTAGGGVNGQFSSVENDFETDTIVTAGVVYESNAVSVEGQQGSFQEFAADAGLTVNQRAVASALDNVVSDSGEQRLIAYLNDRSLEALPGDFDLIAPDELAAIYAIGVAQATVQGLNLQRRLSEIRQGSQDFSASGLAVTGMMPMDADLPPVPTAETPSPDALQGTAAASVGPATGLQGPAGTGGKELRAPSRQIGTFITGVGEFTHIGDTSNAAGYDLATGGFTLGADIRIGENLAVGLSAGYARSGGDLSQGGSLTVDGAKLGVYATYFNENLYVDAAIQGGYNSYDTRRTALQGTARGSTSGGEVTALLAGGYDFQSEALRIGPTASFQYTHVGIGSFRENGSLAPLTYDSQGADSMRLALGMKATYDWRFGGVLIRPELRAAWQHEYGDAAYAIDSRLGGSGSSGAFTVQGPAIGRDSLLLGLGVAVLWNERTSTYVYYDGEIGRENYDSHNVSGGVRLQF